CRDLSRHDAAACRLLHSLSFCIIPRPPTSTLFPYTTLFRSVEVDGQSAVEGDGLQRVGGHRAGEVTADEVVLLALGFAFDEVGADRKSTRLNSSHVSISYAVFCLKKKNKHIQISRDDE